MDAANELRSAAAEWRKMTPGEPLYRQNDTYADRLEQVAAEIERLTAALAECAAEYRMPAPCGIEYLAAEFRRRTQIAANALEKSATEKP